MFGGHQQMTMIVKPTCGRFARDTDLFSKMDPYVVVEINGQTQKTKVHNKGGKTPVWNDSLTFSVTGLEKIAHCKIYDKDAYSSDFVCQADIALHNIFLSKNFTGWVPCTYKGKPSGQIMMTIEILGGNQKQKIDNQQHMNLAHQGVFQMPGMGGYAPAPQVQWPMQAHPQPSMIP